MLLATTFHCSKLRIFLLPDLGVLNEDKIEGQGKKACSKLLYLNGRSE